MTNQNDSPQDQVRDNYGLQNLKVNKAGLPLGPNNVIGPNNKHMNSTLQMSTKNLMLSNKALIQSKLGSARGSLHNIDIRTSY